MAEGGIALAVVKATHGNGGRHLSQGVIRLVGQRLSAQELPDGLGGGEQVDHGQKGLERGEREKKGKDLREQRVGEGAGKSPSFKLRNREFSHEWQPGDVHRIQSLNLIG